MNYWSEEILGSNYKYLYSEGKQLISEEEKSAILKDLYSGLNGYDVFQYFGSQPNIFFDYDHLVVAKEYNNRYIGLIGSKWFTAKNGRFLYIWTAIVVEDYQKSNLIHKMTTLMLNRAFKKDGIPNVITTKTYNPNVYKIFNTYSRFIPGSQVYPNINASDNFDQILMENIAIEVSECVFPKLQFDKEIGVVHKGQSALAPNFFPSLPFCKDKKTFDYFQENLTPADQILTIIFIPEVSKKLFEENLLDKTFV